MAGDILATLFLVVLALASIIIAFMSALGTNMASSGPSAEERRNLRKIVACCAAALVASISLIVLIWK